MAKLWKKSETKMHPAVEKYTAGTDHTFDMEIFSFDIMASRAHARMLANIDVLSAEEMTHIESAFNALQKELDAGHIAIRTEDEDCHTVIENYLVEKIGEAGKKIHTGRSRNDQVAVAVRLYMKHHLKEMEKCVRMLAGKFLDFAEKYENMPMPGYSHTQQAMLSTVGHYFAAYAESLLDDADFVVAVRAHLDKNPLGTAAGFGTAIPVDREFTTRELGFSAMQVNSLYVQNARGKYESIYLEALAQMMQTLGRFASDMILFTSQEFGFFSVDQSVTTGSSIMPHKKNLDPLEIMRGNVSVVVGNQYIVKNLTKNLISGYHRDGQLIKKPLMESTQIVESSIEVAGIVLAALAPDPDTIRAKISSGIFTADIANEMVQKDGVPFRDAYKKAAEIKIRDIDLSANIASKKSLGAPGNISIDILRRRMK